MVYSKKRKSVYRKNKSSKRKSVYRKNKSGKRNAIKRKNQRKRLTAKRGGAGPTPTPTHQLLVPSGAAGAIPFNSKLHASVHNQGHNVIQNDVLPLIQVTHTPRRRGRGRPITKQVGTVRQRSPQPLFRLPNGTTTTSQEEAFTNAFTGKGKGKGMKPLEPKLPSLKLLPRVTSV